MRVGLIGVGRIGELHAETLSSHARVDKLIITDADHRRSSHVAARLGADLADSVPDLLAVGLDGVVIAAPTAAHGELVRAAAKAGVPIFCEKPLAADVAETRQLLDVVNMASVPLQIGFQRRFDAGFRAVREAVQTERLGWLHTIRAYTCDPVPPHPEYFPSSGGIFRDCSVHDFDAVRWVTGHEVVNVYAEGANRGADFIADAGDVDTGAVILTLDDGTLGLCSATRYNGAGYDVRLEACGTHGTLVAGLDDRSPLTSASAPDGPGTPPYRDFLDRFRIAYIAELEAFLDVATGQAHSPCTGEDALEAMLVAEAADMSRRDRRVVGVDELRE
jgi:myo-inositol 2-dehydrogenase/D-chiro-inositol 1-dehydrogenase